jgi:hypothetical protein
MGEVSRDGTWVPAHSLFPARFRVPPYFDAMVADAERVSRGTDLVRIDFMCGSDGYVIGEATPLSTSRISPGAEQGVVNLLIDGYVARQGQRKAPGASL